VVLISVSGLSRSLPFPVHESHFRFRNSITKLFYGTEFQYYKYLS
jgi:hypothetical protein